MKEKKVEYSALGLVLLGTLVFIILVNYAQVNAEKIYCKDGRIVDANIVSLDNSEVQLKHKSGTFGMSLENIEKIENNDGAISKYDFRSLAKEIEEFIRQGKYNEAVGLCDLLLESLPDYNRIRYLRAILSQKISNLEKASEDYRFLIAHTAADAKVFNNLGVIYASQGKNDEAVTLFRKAIKENPNMAEAHHNLAELLMRAKDYQQAVEEYHKVISLEPNSTEVLYNLGVAYLNAKVYSKAKACWEKILAVVPEDKDAKKALEYLKLKKF
jgi:tetratricopeptide (TPR) repeat protein